MGDTLDFVRIIKQIALEAVEAAKPAGFVFGTVVSAAPLSINVEQKLTLTEAQIILTRNVTDYYVDMTVDHETEDSLNWDTTHSHSYSGETDPFEGETEPGDGHVHEMPHAHEYAGVTDNNDTDLTHRHDYVGRKTFLVHNALQPGERVVLAVMQGGQRYIVLDRTGGEGL